QGYGLGLLLPPLLTLLLVSQRQHVNLVSDVLVFLLLVVGVALVGGFPAGLVAVVGGSLLLNYYFPPPLHTFTISERNNVLALGVFLVVAALVSSVVDLAARRTRQASRATAEAEMLATLAGSVLRGETALPALLERVREAFALSSVTLLERTLHSAPGRGASRGRGARPAQPPRIREGRRDQSAQQRHPMVPQGPCRAAADRRRVPGPARPTRHGGPR